MSRAKNEGLFQRRPDRADMPLRWEVFRVPAKGEGGMVCLSADVVGAYTHYVGGRTRFCSGSSCAYCEENAERRWYGYLAVTNKVHERFALLEITAGSCESLDRFHKLHGSLRGAVLRGRRVPAKANGRLYYDLRMLAKAERDALPQAPNVARILTKMWSLPGELSSQADGELLPASVSLILPENNGR